MTTDSDPTRDFFEKFPRETLFRTFLNQVDFSVCFKDKEHRYMLCSSSFVRLVGHKTPEELVGKTVFAILNLPARKMMGLESNGMLISAVHHEGEEEKLNLLMVDPHIPAGAKLY